VSRKNLALLLGGLAMVVVVVGLALVFSPPWFVPDKELTSSDRIKLLAESSVRATIVQFVAGLVVVLGLAYTAAQVRISRETHFTDRYTKAIDQLGHSAPSVRMGAIFALKRLAANSKVDRPVVLDMLTGYLKVHLERPPQLEGTTADPPTRARLTPDAQTALTVLIGLHADST
jgi:ABC-type glucose/galactose transport system permease subunit